MRIGIIGSTREIARLKMNKILKEDLERDFECYFTQECINIEELDLKYYILPAMRSIRGYKFDKAYVDTKIEEEFIFNTIYGNLIISKLPENEQIIYY